MSPIDALPLGEAPELNGIVAFLRRVGIEVAVGAVPNDAPLPGMTIADGRLVYDPAKPGWVGDLLHEAGHLAVTHPAKRPTLRRVDDDPAEEMAAIAWSYAASRAIGLPIGTLFHPGYAAGAECLIEAFAHGGSIGVPMLRLWGMTGDRGVNFPAMRTWLRPE